MSFYPVGSFIPVSLTLNHPTTQQPVAASAISVKIWAIGTSALQAYSTTLLSTATGWYTGRISTASLSAGADMYALRALATVSAIQYQGQIDPAGFQLVSANNTSAAVVAGGLVAMVDNTIDLISQARSDIAGIWSQASGITITYDTLFSRIYQLAQNKETAVNATGAFTLRNIGDSADLASWSLTDDDTITTRTEVVWI